VGNCDSDNYRLHRLECQPWIHDSPVFQFSRERLMEQFQWEIAVTLAVKWHEGQMYGPYPYVKHLQDVDNILITRKFTTKTQSEQYIKVPREERDLLRATVWLHDIREDTACTDQDLRDAGICEEVIIAVGLLTKVEGYDKRQYLERIIENSIAREVKICDSWANAQQNVLEGNLSRAARYAHQFHVLVLGEWYEFTMKETEV
jgi:(p)ppGpp synthase/HD superfamily hydrolase